MGQGFMVSARERSVEPAALGMRQHLEGGRVDALRLPA
jgi:hypothetical protein